VCWLYLRGSRARASHVRVLVCGSRFVSAGLLDSGGRYFHITGYWFDAFLWDSMVQPLYPPTPPPRIAVGQRARREPVGLVEAFSLEKSRACLGVQVQEHESNEWLWLVLSFVE